ncbi:hypothetical protein EDB85DRAFT_1892581 [Lactarius pseudohatsudake]|nr:hypothetical protein EDB85DRAFT_1892580 [Lactarius pseudohatsudake]KAH9028287.1 hypothetical protein EDB85DRAFT_1892581 [Lactarius pseudohatsudake]
MARRRSGAIASWCCSGARPPYWVASRRGSCVVWLAPWKVLHAVAWPHDGLLRRDVVMELARPAGGVMEGARAQRVGVVEGLACHDIATTRILHAVAVVDLRVANGGLRGEARGALLACTGEAG